MELDQRRNHRHRGHFVGVSVFAVLWCACQICGFGAKSGLSYVPGPSAALLQLQLPESRTLPLTEKPSPLPGASRRSLALPLSAALLSVNGYADLAFAGSGEDNPFSVELKGNGWKLKKELRQAIRVRKEKVFDASDASTGARVTITRTPLGADQFEEEKRGRLLDLVGAFDANRKSQISAEDIVKILTANFDDVARRRDAQWLAVQRRPGVQDYTGPGGQRYVSYEYDVQECSGFVTEFTKDDGTTIEECDGKVQPWRRHYVSASVLPTTFTSMKNEEMNKVFEALWFLDASAPVKKIEAKGSTLAAELADAARSFSVTPTEFKPAAADQ